MKIMVADDERDLCSVVEKIVARRGYAFCCAHDGLEALEVFERERPDVVILDVMMPEKNGFDVCRDIRAQNERVPILFLSAKSDIVDKGVGFSAGADDYLAKPFSNEELLMRIEAALRRARLSDGPMEPRGRSVVTIGDLEVRLKRNEALVRGERVALTPKEFQILALLADHAGQVFTARDIIENVWGEEYVEGSVSIPVFIRRIREKIEDDPSKPRYVQTVWRTGYRLGDAAGTD